MKICIVGGGLVGLAVARKLRRSHPIHEVMLLEKEADFGCHQSTHNSGVLHAGLYYKPGTEKARLAVDGIRQMVDYCREHHVRHEICGKVVVATSEEEIGRLRLLQERGRQNGLSGLRWLEAAELKEFEPNAAGLAALHVPQEGIVNYRDVCDALAKESRGSGVELRTNARVRTIRSDGSSFVIEAGEAEIRADFIVNCAGLHSDRVSRLAGHGGDVQIVPFRGEYYKLRASAQHLVRNLVYPVPDPLFPFLGVHFTRMITGGIEAGPNAVLAFAREGYTKSRINLRDLAQSLAFPGLWRFIGRHRSLVFEELKRSFSRELFCRSLQRLIPAIQPTDLETGGAGVRAQAMQSSGQLVQDFAFVERPGALQVINAPSPAATAALAIADTVVARIPLSR